MATRLLLKNATIVNEGLSFRGAVFVVGEKISEVLNFSNPGACERCEILGREIEAEGGEVVNLEGLYLIPGLIDSHVHFREPGATHKGCIASESAAAVLGGVTSYMDMPNNTPLGTSLEALENKFEIAGRESAANYSFYLGANDDNFSEIESANPQRICGIKVFLGLSTGGMLVSRDDALQRIFAQKRLPVMVHCEDNGMIAANLKAAKEKYGENIPVSAHPEIRSTAACLKSTEKVVRLAMECGTRLHVLHVSTAAEMMLLRMASEKTGGRITAETCVQYLCFDSGDYERYGARIKCNPAIKSAADRISLVQGLSDGSIYTVATDHAPHLLSEKQGGYLQAASGIPLIQFSLQMMLELVKLGQVALPQAVELMAHNPARLFNIEGRGFIRPGCYADLAVFDLNRPSSPEPASRCGWSPVGTFSSTICRTYVNGALAACDGILTGNRSARELRFNR
ncbi:MAG: dihydroorotase [Bacteroidales bacterium]|nr:dihydroorotase [Bacteroidales bacterium]